MKITYLRADQDLEEQRGNANAPPWRIWLLCFGLSAKPKHFATQAGRECGSGSCQPVCLPIGPAANAVEKPEGTAAALDLFTL